MLNRILVYGLVAGLVVAVPMFATVLGWRGDGDPPSALIGYTIMLVALSLVFVAVKRHRDVAQGGVIKFFPALGMGLAISVVAGIIYVIAWELTLAVSGFDFAGKYAEHLIAQQRAKGVAGEALAAFEAEMAAFKASYANPLFRMPMTFVEIFPVGAFVSLISAALLRNSRFLPPRRE
ncbi:MAG: DUF4199 domain-containing protein [Hyphomonadaceae bacterium]|nr:DUF4199 domain-containing protein [Hyphomonadaceae bacterium]